MGGGSSQLIFLLIMVALLVFMFSRTRKQQRAQQQMQSGVAPGSRVMTTSGMFGTVVEIDGDEVVLEIAPGLQTRWTRRAVARVVTPTEATPYVAEETPAADSGLSLEKRDGDAAGGAARSQ